MEGAFSAGVRAFVPPARPLEAPVRQPLPLLALLVAGAAAAAPGSTDPAPEIQRDPAPPQAVGQVHTLRNIPEACARLQGRFTGDAAHPYAFAVGRTSARCQPRARLVDADKVGASTGTGWILNDVIRVPSAACATRQAVVRVWRHPAAAAPPALDAQGRSRIYLAESMSRAKAEQLAPVPMYAVAMDVDGLPCKGD